MEYESEGTWRIKAKEGQYWALGAANAIQTSSKEPKIAGHFRLKWNNDEGSCNILASNKVTDAESAMKWICARKSGQLYVGNSDPVGFFIVFQNRTSLNLRASTGSGFVGLKMQGTSKLEASKTSPDSIIVEYGNSESQHDQSDDTNQNEFDCCYFKMPANNKYWSIIDGNQVACDSTTHSCAQQFLIELRTNQAIAIRLFESSQYLTTSGQGALAIKGCSPSEATLWEF